MWKVLVLLAGAAGVLGFFQPLVEYRGTDGRVVTRTSAYEIVTTPNDTSALAEIALGFGVSPEDAELLNERLDQGVVAYRSSLIAFYVPAALLALLGLISLLRWRMGRFSGLLAVVLGVANGVVFCTFFEATKRQADPNVALGWGIWLLLGAASGGVLAGLGALVLPDRGHVRLTHGRDDAWD